MKKYAPFVFVAALAPVVAIGCGSSDDDEKAKAPPPTAVVIEQTGGKKDPTLKAPTSVKAGPATVTVKNSSQADAGAQLVLVEGDHSTDEALKLGNAWGEKGKALPDWIKLQGGVGAVKPGETKSVTEVLPGGNYLVLNIDSGAHTDMKVTGTASGSAPSQAAKITAAEYSFTGTGLKTGKQKILFENKGKQPHFLAAGPIASGKTIADVKKAVTSEDSQGPPPIDEKSSVDTAIIEGGGKQVVELDLKKPGKYAFMCFVPDRQGGPPHVAKGMVSEVEVK